MPKKSFQVPRPVLRTYSVHNLQGYTPHPSEFTQNTWPSQCQSLQPLHDDDQSDDYLHDGNQSPQENHENERPTCDIKPDIDEVSPDEDDRMARSALRGINSHIKLSHTNTFTDPNPEHEPEDYNLNLEDTCQIPSDRDIGMYF